MSPFGAWMGNSEQRRRGNQGFSKIGLWAIAILAAAFFVSGADAVMGVNYGTMSPHLLPPKTVVKLLQANKITKVKLFDANFDTVRAFAGTDIEVMVAIPNDMLQTMADSPRAAEKWVKHNVSRFFIDKGVNIKYVAVGNEPFLTAYNGSFLHNTVPAMDNIHRALVNAKIDDRVKVTVPLNADVLSNGGVSVPSAGIFRPDIQDLMVQLVRNLDQYKSPFTVNIYPFLSLQQDSNFPKEFAFFDGNAPPTTDGSLVYTNVFDASYDLLVSALRKNGFANMPIIVGEVGWPTDGDINANVANAQRFYKGLIQHVGKGTPLVPNQPLEVYMFSLTDEDGKSVAPGNFERHWGIFGFDGQAKYEIDLTGSGAVNGSLVSAQGVDYLARQWCVLDRDGGGDLSKLGEKVGFACTFTDCTPLEYGGSCNDIGSDGNVSYAFNSYYQLNDQVKNSCEFGGLGKVTTVDPSQGTCKFKVGIVPYSSGFTSVPSLLALLLTAILVLLLG